MSDRTYFRAEGKSLEIIRDWTEAVRAYLDRMSAIQRRIGATAMFTHNDRRVAGFAFPLDAELPKILRRIKEQPERVVPNGRYKAGRELRDEMDADTPASQMQLTSMLLGGGPKIIGAASGGGFYMGLVSFETIGDDIIISVPHLQDGEAAGIPDDAVELKMSEYWTLKETAEAAA